MIQRKLIPLTAALAFLVIALLPKRVIQVPGSPDSLLATSTSTLDRTQMPVGLLDPRVQKTETPAAATRTDIETHDINRFRKVDRTAENLSHPGRVSEKEMNLLLRDPDIEIRLATLRALRTTTPPFREVIQTIRHKTMDPAANPDETREARATLLKLPTTVADRDRVMRSLIQDVRNTRLSEHERSLSFQVLTNHASQDYRTLEIAQDLLKRGGPTFAVQLAKIFVEQNEYNRMKKKNATTE